MAAGDAQVCLPSRAKPLASSKFASFPNPVLYLLRNVDGLTIGTKQGVKQILWFLVELEQHASTFGVDQSTLLTLLYPLAEGNLQKLISRAIDETLSLQGLRELVRDELPFRWCRELEASYLWQMQGAGETLGEYIKRVRTAYLALRPVMPEGQVIANVVEGMSPQYRTQLLVLGRPLEWEQLLNGVKEISRFALVDEQREHSEKGANKVIEQGRGSENRRPDPRRCFRCGSKEHLVRQCPVPREPRENR